MSSALFAGTASAAGFLFDVTGYVAVFLLCAMLALAMAAAAQLAPDIIRADRGCRERRETP